LAIHNVPVPEEDLDAVFQLLASRAKARETAADRSASEIDGGSDNATEQKKDAIWSEAMLRRVAKSEVVSTHVLSDIMDVLARDPNGSGAYTRPELVDLTNHEPGRVANTFTKLTPHFEKHYGTNVWPIVVENGQKMDPPRSALTYYWISPGVADRWRTIRGF
jgi:hypothetical protein